MPSGSLQAPAHADRQRTFDRYGPTDQAYSHRGACAATAVHLPCQRQNISPNGTIYEQSTRLHDCLFLKSIDACPCASLLSVPLLLCVDLLAERSSTAARAETGPEGGRPESARELTAVRSCDALAPAVFLQYLFNLLFTSPK